jgi:hypothetical protein
MECHNIREKLVAYMDGDVPSGGKMLIDEHLQSCRKCRQYLADLRKTVGYVRSLEDVEPPVWLAHRVMAKIKSESGPEKGILRRLFYPLHIKLPIEAVVAVLMAVTTIYVFRTIQPEMKIERAPSEEIARQVPSTPLSPQRISPREEEQVGKGGFEAEKPVPDGKPEILDRSSELSKAPEMFAKQDKNMPSAGAMARSEIKRETLPAGPQNKALSDACCHEYNDQCGKRRNCA